ncbi:MAG: HYExAFE family protein, partial [Planctomycetota bacterium]
FENWLKDNRIRYLAIDENKRASFGCSKIKSFDFVLYPPNQNIIIAEVKGRTFKGTSFTNLKGFDCWVTMDDIEGMAYWGKYFGGDYLSAFVFAYRIKKIDVDLDGRDTFDYDGNKYIFFAIKLDDYQAHMKLRSQKWKTVTLPAAKFREFAIQLEELLT